MSVKGRIFDQPSRTNSAQTPDGFEAGTARIFIDIDTDPTTGYPIHGIGADNLIEIAGHKGRLTKSELKHFNPYYRMNTDATDPRAKNDWSSWETVTPIKSSISDNKLETQVYLNELNSNSLTQSKNNAEVYVHLTDHAGNTDDLDIVSSDSTSGALSVKQTSLYTSSIVPVSQTIEALELELYANGNDVNVNNIILSQSASIYAINDRTSPLDFPITVNKGEPRYLIIRTTLDGPAQPGDVFEFEIKSVDAGDVPVTVSGDGLKGYVDVVPTEIVIDGLFEVWQDIEKDIDEDKSEISNPNIDIDTYAIDMGSGSEIGGPTPISFYLQVKGEMLAGTIIPAKNPVLNDDIVDPTPTVSVGDNKDRPLPALPSKTGEDSVYIFLDADNDASTGYKPGNTFPIGADYVVEIIGQYGEIISSNLLKFEGLNPYDFNFIEIEPVEAGCDNKQIETQINIDQILGSTLPDVYFHIVDWEGTDDHSKFDKIEFEDDKKFNIHIRSTRASDSVTTYSDSGFSTTAATFGPGATVYVLVTDGVTTGGIVGADAVDITNSDQITFDVRDDGAGLDDTSGDGDYKGSFVVVYDGGISGTFTSDASDILDLDYGDSANIICDLDLNLDPGFQIITLIPEFPSVPLPILFTIMFIAIFKVRKIKLKGGNRK